jgi:DNA-directed RNA polymerase subunit RPC12/RpoP
MRGQFYVKKNPYRCLQCLRPVEKSEVECQSCKDKFIMKMKSIKPSIKHRIIEN